MNCGPPPPILLGSDGTIHRLEATSCVLGMFDEWTGDAHEILLAPGDLLALYTDGVTEAVDRQGQEFGAEGLAATLRRLARAPSKELLNQVLGELQRFAQGPQGDDITMVIARCLP